MKNSVHFQKNTLAALISLAVASLYQPQPAQAAESSPVDLGTVGGSSGSGAANSSSVYVKEGTAAAVAPTQANLSATQPQSVISRAYIENSTPPTGNFNTITGIAPSVATTPSTNGPGLADQKMSLRGFQDGEYNVTFDGIPFGDTNGPTHHSTSYFPAAVIGGMVIERGPGNASNIGYSTYGGSVNLFSKTPAQDQQFSLYGAYGRWNTQLEGVGFESGRMQGSDATLQINAQNMSSDGYLSYSKIKDQNLTAKYQRPVGEASLLTLFGSFDSVRTNVTDNASGPTMAQLSSFGQNYVMNDNSGSQGYYGYNTADKKTDMEYVRLQSSLGAGWETDNNLYTYAYKNETVAGQDPSLYTVAGDSKLSITTLAKSTITLPNGGVPGYLKLNQYRVWGDLLKATKKLDDGLLRMGMWWEHSKTERHNFEANLSLGGAILNGVNGQPAGVVTTSNFAQQDSHWNQYQPFLEYEWAVAPGVVVTPGYKYMSYTMGLSSAANQGSQTAQDYQFTYHASLPFLTVNKKLDEQNSLYAQYAKGMQVPFIGLGTPSSSRPDPQTTTNYQFGMIHKSDQLTLDADIYYIDMNNMQLNVGTKANPNYINAGGAIYKGIETEGTYVIGAGVSVYANYTINSANYKSANAAVGQPTGEVPNAPNITAGLGLIYQQGPWDGSLMFKRIGEQYSSKINGQLPHIDNTDLNLGYTLKNFSGLDVKSLKLQLSIFNLTNQQRLVAASGPLASATTQYQWQAPRSYMVSAKADF